MLMILARLVRSESFWAVAKVRSPHTGPGIRYIIACGADDAASNVHLQDLAEHCRHAGPWVEHELRQVAAEQRTAEASSGGAATNAAVAAFEEGLEQAA